MRIVARNSRQARIDDDAHAGNRQRSFRDIRRNDDLARSRRSGCDGAILRFGGKLAVERKHDALAPLRRRGNGGNRFRNFVSARHEDEKIALGFFVKNFAKSRCGVIPHGDARCETVAPQRSRSRSRDAGGGGIFDFYRKKPSARRQRFARRKPLRERVRVERCRHDDDEQIRTRRALQAHRHRKRDVGIKMAFVKFIENDRADFFRLRSVPAEQLTQKQPLGDKFDARFGGFDAIETNLISDLAAERLTAFPRDARREHARRQTPRLQHDDFFPGGNESIIEQHLRNLRRFPGTRRRLKHNATGTCARFAQTFPQLKNRQSLRLFVARHGVRASRNPRRNERKFFRVPAQRSLSPRMDTEKHGFFFLG